VMAKWEGRFDREKMKNYFNENENLA